MRSVVVVVVALVLSTIIATSTMTHAHEVVATNGHKCIHHEVQGPIKEATATRTFSAAARESIRIHVDYDNLDDSSKYCATESGTGPKHLFGGGTASCSGYALTAAKVTILKTKIVPKAVEYLQKLYKVDRLSSYTEASSNYCGSNTLVDTGTFNDHDMRIYVTAGPQDSANTLAYAYTCTKRSGSNQPLTAVINFNAQYIKWDDSFDSYNNFNVVQTAIHEIHHALGFNTVQIDASAQTRTIRGKSVKYINTTKVLAMAKNYSGCSTSVGVEIEDEGGSGTAGAHWERRNVPEELMCGLGGTRLSPFSLAFMEDTTWYDADYSLAQNMTVGRGQGCDFIDEKCNVAAGGRDTAWFFDEAYGCSSDFRVIGKGTWAAASTAPPSHEIYDTANPTFGDESSLADYCPYPNRVLDRECEHPSSTTTSEVDTIMGMYYGTGGRCFRSDGVKKSAVSVSFNSRCFKSRCPFGGKRIEMAVGSNWIACPLDGSTKSDVVAPLPYEGNIVCPLATIFCADDITSGSSVKPEKPVTSSSIDENSGASLVAGKIVLNGTKWVDVFSSTTQKIDLLNSLRIDLAFFLGLDYKSFRTKRTTVSNDGVEIIIQVIDDGDNHLTPTAVSDRFKQFSTVSPAPLALTTTAYAQYGSASEAITIRSYYISEPSSGSICSNTMTEEKCLMMIGIIVIVGSTLIIWILMYCVCCRNPFDTPPIPPSGSGKSNFTDIKGSSTNTNSGSAKYDYSQRDGGGKDVPANWKQSRQNRGREPV